MYKRVKYNNWAVYSRLTLCSSLRQLTKSVGLFCHDDLDIDEQIPAQTTQTQQINNTLLTKLLRCMAASTVISVMHRYGVCASDCPVF